MNRRPRIYVAGPITATDKDHERRNVERAIEIGKQLFAAGWAPLIPHLSWYADEQMGLNHEEWLELDLPWVETADAVFRMDGPSIGAEREVGQANRLNIPVFFEDGNRLPTAASFLHAAQGLLVSSVQQSVSYKEVDPGVFKVLSKMETASRKGFPVATGVVDYFPDALLAVAETSQVGNDQHNPGQPLTWDRSKSTDEADALMRHFLERGSLDSDGLRHSAKVAWRALAMLQKEIEAEGIDLPSVVGNTGDMETANGGSTHD